LFLAVSPNHPFVISFRLHYLLSRLVGFQARKECVVV